MLQILRPAIFLFLLNVCLCPGLCAQNRVYAGLGLNFSYASPDSLDYIVQAFNAEATWADKPMREIHTPMGITGHLGADLNRVLLEIGYTMRMQTSRAKGTLSGTSTRATHLRYSTNTIDIGLGYFLTGDQPFRVALGASLDFGTTRIRYRTGTAEQVVALPFGILVNELNFAATGFVHMSIALGPSPGPGIWIRPYFQYAFVQNDFGPANRALRQQSALSDPYFILGQTSNAGIKVGVNFGS